MTSRATGLAAHLRRTINGFPIRRKILAGTALVLSVVAIFSVVYYPYRQEQAALAAKRDHARNLAGMVALGIGIGMHANDSNTVDATVSWARTDSSLDILVAVDSTGRQLAAHNTEHAAIDPALLGRSPTMREDRERLEIGTPIIYDGTYYGSVLIGLSLNSVHEKLRRDRETTLGILALIFGFSVLLSAVLARWVAEPIEQLRLAADEIAKGNFDVEMPASSRDEVGALADAFRLMVAELRASIQSLAALAKEIGASRDTAIAAAQAKSEFLATMSHEIRTPLNGVIGMLGLLRGTELNAEQREFTETAHASADVLLTVINDILDFSKVEAGKLELECIDFDPRRTIEESLAVVAERAHEKGLELLSYCHPNVPARVKGDPVRLRQVLLNLVGNAIKFTEDGEVSVRARVEHDDDDAVTLRIDVTDTGIGMTPEEVNQLFQPFHQADASTTRRFGGTGLGLAISERLVSAMHGTISVRSEAGEGSNFRLTVRLQRSEMIDTDTATPDRLRGVRVLVVDDNRTNRRIMQHQLGAWGSVCDTAEDAVHALARLREAGPEGYPIAVLDMQMPGMDGLALARVIKADPLTAQMKILLLTSLQTRRLQPDAIVAGIDAVLTKPVREAQLRERLNQLLEPTALGEVPALPPVSADAPPPPPAPAAVSANDAPAATRLLLVEDNEVNRKVALAMLARLGYHADIAGNGIEALDAVAATRYDAILMDCQMPLMDGLEATRRIREMEPAGVRIPIIAMTANALPADRERCLDAGMDDYLSKPIEAALLADALRAQLARASRVPVPTIVAPAAAQVQGAPGSPPVRLARLEAIIGNDPATLREFLATFTTIVGDLVVALGVAARDGERAMARRLAHQIRGASASIGADDLAALSAELERLAADDRTDDLAPLFQRVDAAYARVAAFITNF